MKLHTMFGCISLILTTILISACGQTKDSKSKWTAPWQAPEEQQSSPETIDSEVASEDQSSLVGGISSAKGWVGYWQSKQDQKILRLSDKYLDKYRDQVLKLYLPHFMWSPLTGDRQQTPTKGLELKVGASRKFLTANFLVMENSNPAERVSLTIESKTDAELELVWIKESISGKLIAKITQTFIKLNYELGERLYRQELARYPIEYLRHHSYQKTVYDDDFCRKETELVGAAAMGEINCVKYILDNFPKINPQLKTQALFKAIENGDLEMISSIFKYKVRFSKELNYAMALDLALRPAPFYLHVGDLSDLEEGIPRYAHAGSVGEYLLKVNPKILESGASASYFAYHALRMSSLDFASKLVQSIAAGQFPNIKMSDVFVALVHDHEFRFAGKAGSLMREALKEVRKEGRLNSLSGEVLVELALEANLEMLKILKEEFRVNFSAKTAKGLGYIEVLNKQIKELKDLAKKPSHAGVNAQYLLLRKIKSLEQNLQYLSRR